MTQLRKMMLEELQRRNYSMVRFGITCGWSKSSPGISQPRLTNWD